MKGSLGMSAKWVSVPVLTSSTLEVSVLSRLLQKGDENCTSELETKMGNDYGVIQEVTIRFNWLTWSSNLMKNNFHNPANILIIIYVCIYSLPPFIKMRFYSQ